MRVNQPPTTIHADYTLLLEFYIEMIFRDPDRQLLIKITVEGKTNFLVHNF